MIGGPFGGVERWFKANGDRRGSSLPWWEACPGSDPVTRKGDGGFEGRAIPEQATQLDPALRGATRVATQAEWTPGGSTARASGADFDRGGPWMPSGSSTRSGLRSWRVQDVASD